VILGVGIDIVDVRRISNWMKDPGLISRYFHEHELARAGSYNGALSLAARFAAKEAFGKALGTGLRNLNLKDICVENDELGKPMIRLMGSAKLAFEQVRGHRLHLSLTHETDNAVAVVIIEGDENAE